MRRVGFTRSYAAGVEACASTGGVLMPPIMGATAFVMATFLEVDYAQIAIAAAIPSALYFLGLFLQIDAHAAKRGLLGLPREELPALLETVKRGWYFIAVFALLIWLLIYLKREAIAPFYATALLILINQALPYHRWSRADFVGFLAATGWLFAELVGVLCGIGLIVGALAVTGITGTIANDLVHLAGGSPFLLLLMGALTSFILGIGMTVTAAYIFLAIALAPALIQGGLEPMAVHMFILYWGMLSFITPPVALGAYAAASVAGARPFETGLQAMRLGSIIYFIPFFFVLNPALLLRGDAAGVLLATGGAVVGIALAAGGLQGYLLGLGDLTRHPLLQWPIRGLILLAGLLVATPRKRSDPLVGSGDDPGWNCGPAARRTPHALVKPRCTIGGLSRRGELIRLKITGGRAVVAHRHGHDDQVPGRSLVEDSSHPGGSHRRACGLHAAGDVAVQGLFGHCDSICRLVGPGSLALNPAGGVLGASIYRA